VVFFVFFELSFFFAKQVLDYSALFGIGSAFEHCPVMVNVLTGDITFHKSSPADRRSTPSLELDQGRVLHFRRVCENGK
jgi:hypothetical protein